MYVYACSRTLRQLSEFHEQYGLMHMSPGGNTDKSMGVSQTKVYSHGIGAAGVLPFYVKSSRPRTNAGWELFDRFVSVNPTDPSRNIPFNVALNLNLLLPP